MKDNLLNQKMNDLFEIKNISTVLTQVYESSKDLSARQPGKIKFYININFETRIALFFKVLKNPKLKKKWKFFWMLEQ